MWLIMSSKSKKNLFWPIKELGRTCEGKGHFKPAGQCGWEGRHGVLWAPEQMLPVCGVGWGLQVFLGLVKLNLHVSNS